MCLQNSRLLFQWHAFLCYIQQNNDSLKGIDIETTNLYMTYRWHSAFSSDNFCSWWRHQMETFSALLALVRGIHRLSVDSPQKGQWRGVLMFLWSAPEQTVNNLETSDSRHNRAHYDVFVMFINGLMAWNHGIDYNTCLDMLYKNICLVTFVAIVRSIFWVRFLSYAWRSSDCAWPITGQVTSVSRPVISWA